MTYQPTDEQIEPIWDAAQDSDEDAFEAALGELIRAVEEQRAKELSNALDQIRRAHVWANARLVPNRSTQAEHDQHASAQHLLNFISDPRMDEPR